jgi:hypothetical protein
MLVTAPMIAQRHPGRGELFPNLSGLSPDGDRISTRDYYMRHSLAIIIAGAGVLSETWVAEAAEVRDAAYDEDGEILLVVPEGSDTRGLPAIVDADGSLAERLGLAPVELPAIYITDRYGTIFAASRGSGAEASLRPADIPGWLEFVACRCS